MQFKISKPRISYNHLTCNLLVGSSLLGTVEVDFGTKTLVMSNKEGSGVRVERHSLVKSSEKDIAATLVDRQVNTDTLRFWEVGHEFDRRVFNVNTHIQSHYSTVMGTLTFHIFGSDTHTFLEISIVGTSFGGQAPVERHFFKIVKSEPWPQAIAYDEATPWEENNVKVK